MADRELLTPPLRGWRPHLHLKPKDWVLPLTAASLVLGMMLALEFGSQKAAGEFLGRPRADLLAQMLAGERARAKQLESEIIQLRGEKDKYAQAAAAGEQGLTLLNKDNVLYRLALGLTPVAGPGIVLRVNDSDLVRESTGPTMVEPFLIHDYDLWPIVNELRAAGAEAIAINDQRVAATTAIRCVGPVVNVNGVGLSPPYDIKAIGSTKELVGALTIKDGVVDRLRAARFPVNIEERPDIHIPAISVTPKIRYAKAVKEAQK